MVEPNQSNREYRITVEYQPISHGRNTKVFHLFDTKYREVEYPQKVAVRVAKAILKIVKEG